MDPITKMAQEFMNGWLRFRQSGTARLFRIETAPAMHGDLHRLFRAIEMSPANRSPYFIFGGPFSGRAGFYDAAIAQMSSDYALIREGLAKDGVMVDALGPSAAEGEPEEKFARVVRSVWAVSKGRFEYLVLIFLPEVVDGNQEWVASIDRLQGLLAETPVRIAVADIDPPRLGELFAAQGKRALSGRYLIAASALQEYLLKVASGGFGALSGEGPAATGSDEVASLRTYMAQAAVASANRKTDEAMAALAGARGVCRANGLTTHEAMILIALGNTLLAAERPEEAIPYYGEAVETGGRAQAPVVVLQARMGIGGTLFHLQRYGAAAAAYEQAAVDAEAAESDIMRIEAFRMAGTCHNLDGRFEAAIQSWNTALDTGNRASLAEINASTIQQVCDSLVELFEKRGMREQAKSVAGQIQALQEQARLRDAKAAGAPA